jgi:hypothetical protein
VTAAWKAFKRRHYKPLKRRFAPWRTVRYGNIRVHYKKHLDGGGTYFGQDFIPRMKSWACRKCRALSNGARGRASSVCR